ncbi:MAG: ABC transporter substrate-binding protein [Chloroflexales bacterium]|nr:ABC transporter substrate-binding protein [Chloroflexales bacterium]
MKRITRLFTLFVLLVLLAACGGQPAAEGVPDPATAPMEEASEETAEEREAAAPAEGFPVTVTDAHGHAVTVEAPPENMICMNLHCTHTLAFIGEVPEGILASPLAQVFDHPNYFDYFEEAASIDVTFIPTAEYEADYEEILAFDPDFVWAGGDEDYVAIADFVPTYQHSFDASSLDAFFADTRNAARIFGKTREAEANIATLLQRAEAYTTASGRTLTIYYGFPTDDEGSSFLLQAGGIICLVAAESQCNGSLEAQWREYALEGLFALDPDVLIIEAVSTGGAYAEQLPITLANLADNPLWQELPVVNNERVLVLDRLTTAPRPSTPLAFRMWLDGVMPLIYPDIFDSPLMDKEVQEILVEQ